MQKIRGISLVEFMIAMGLSVVVTAGALSLFSSHTASFMYLDGLARIQENGRFLLHHIKSEVRMAGYMGCLNLTKISPNIIVKNPSENLNLFNGVGISGYEGKVSSHAPTLPTVIASKVRGETDVLLVFRGDQQIIPITKQMVNPNNPIHVEDRTMITQEEVVTITDCETADIFAANSNHNSTVIGHASSNNSTNFLSKAYGTNAHVMKFHSYLYYIGDSGRTNQNGETIFSLFRSNIQGIDEELIEGVENLQITYGIDSKGDQTVDQFLDAEAVASANQFQNVISIKIDALVSSVAPVTGNP